MSVLLEFVNGLISIQPQDDLMRTLTLFRLQDTLMHTSYKCDAYRQFVKPALETKSKNPPSVGDDAIESRPGAGPMISTKRVPEKDSWYRHRKVQNNIPRPGFTSRDTCFGQLNIVLIPKEDRMEMRVEYPKPIDRPQVSGALQRVWRDDDPQKLSSS